MNKNKLPLWARDREMILTEIRDLEVDDFFIKQKDPDLIVYQVVDIDKDGIISYVQHRNKLNENWFVGDEDTKVYKL